MQEYEPESQPLDPVALSLAVWLRLMVGAMGLQRLSAEAAMQQALHAPTIEAFPAQAMLAFGN